LTRHGFSSRQSRVRKNTSLGWVFAARFGNILRRHAQRSIICLIIGA
jgi:hypothetical protein